MVGLANTGLDTRREADRDRIVDLLDWSTTLTSAQVTQFRMDLEAQAGTSDGLTAFEKQLLPEARLCEARILDVEYVRGLAAESRGVWAAGRVLHGPDIQTIFATEAARAGKGEGAYALHGYNVSQAELEASARDCEVPILEQLSDHVTSKMRTLVGPLHIHLSGSMGPCEGCQGRILQVIRDLNSVARNVGATLTLIFEVKYTTPLQERGAKHLPRKTQYGYTNARKVDITNSHVGQYWVKSLVVALGSSTNPTIKESPS